MPAQHLQPKRTQQMVQRCAGNMFMQKNMWEAHSVVDTVQPNLQINSLNWKVLNRLQHEWALIQMGIKPYSDQTALRDNI